MARIWVGDFRIKAIQDAIKKTKSQEDDKYFCIDTAEHYWFSTVAANQVAAELSEKSSVFILLGFNDCVNSCVWQALKINQIVADYVKTINSLVEKHSGINFYFCAIPAVDAGYSFAGYENNIIPADTLNNKIKSFNTTIKETCSATYIDCYSYLADTGFCMRDGIRFTTATAESMLNFISTSSSSVTAVVDFKPRTTVPSADGTSDNIQFWRGVFHDGLNPFDDLLGHTNTKYIGDTLPNCTAYAWGRFYEILGDRPTLSTSNAEYWYLTDGKHGYGDDGYKRGSTPALGAIICWQKGEIGGEAGHVAVVEQINDDGSIVTSESGWNDSRYWWLKTRNNDDGNWGAGEGSTFQGFIYNPAVTATPNQKAAAVDKSQVTTHTGVTTQEERETNALYIYKYLTDCGWTINAIAGLLGNLEHESWINPGVTELGGHGFGLVQWTPPSKFTDWCDAQTPQLKHDDVDSQLARIEHERYHGIATESEENHDKWAHTPSESGKDLCGCGQYFYRTTDSYGDAYAITFTPKTLNDFALSTKSPRDLACAFLYNYECPGSICWGANTHTGGKKKTVAQREEFRAVTRKKRGDAAEKWYKFLLPYSTQTGVYEEKTILTGLKIDKYAPTSIKASFIYKNGKSCNYRILDSSKNELDKQSITLEQYSSTVAKYVSFEIKKLIPAKDFTLIAEMVGADDAIFTETLEFTMVQDYPESVKSVELTCNDKIASADSEFTLKVIKPGYLGYWKAKCGYEKRLYINGKLVKTIEEEVKDITESFKIKDEFGYAPKVGDTIQVGICTFVKDDNDEKIYNNNSPTAKTSKPICLLTKPVTAYLNIK